MAAVGQATEGSDASAEALEALLATRVGDALIRAAEGLLGEPIDARLAAVNASTNEAGFDPFGFDPRVARYVLALAALLHRRYFRTEVHGIENVPGGRALFIANHSGQIPLDGAIIAAALIMDAEPPVFPRSMVERFVARMPFASFIFPRCGQVLGSPDNARRLLREDQTLMVFPEGARGISKPYSDRYQLQGFGSGFMRLALETQTPIVPVALVGAEEQYPAVANLEGIAKKLGTPTLPVIPQLLVGMWLPLPVRYRLYFGEPMMFEGDPDDDDAVMAERVDSVKERIQGMLDAGLASREHVFW